MPFRVARFGVVCCALGALSPFSPRVDVAFARPQTAIQQAGTSSGPNKSYAVGLEALRKGDIAASRKAFESSVRQSPKSAEAHHMLGWVLFLQNETAPAIAELQQAIRLDPSLLNAHLLLSGAYISARDVPNGLREARTAVELAPNAAQAHQLRPQPRDHLFRRDMPLRERLQADGELPAIE
jgi:Tfp pilus assembly protein PilF